MVFIPQSLACSCACLRFSHICFHHLSWQHLSGTHHYLYNKTCLANLVCTFPSHLKWMTSNTWHFHPVFWCYYLFIMQRVDGVNYNLCAPHTNKRPVRGFLKVSGILGLGLIKMKTSHSQKVQVKKKSKSKYCKNGGNWLSSRTQLANDSKGGERQDV